MNIDDPSVSLSDSVRPWIFRNIKTDRIPPKSTLIKIPEPISLKRSRFKFNSVDALKAQQKDTPASAAASNYAYNNGTGDSYTHHMSEGSETEANTPTHSTRSHLSYAEMSTSRLRSKYSSKNDTTAATKYQQLRNPITLPPLVSLPQFAAVDPNTSSSSGIGVSMPPPITLSSNKDTKHTADLVWDKGDQDLFIRDWKNVKKESAIRQEHMQKLLGPRTHADSRSKMDPRFRNPNLRSSLREPTDPKSPKSRQRQHQKNEPAEGQNMSVREMIHQRLVNPEFYRD